MDNLIKVHSLSTELTDRVLWFDGDSSYDPSNLHKLPANSFKYVQYITEDVLLYNKNVPKSQELSIKLGCNLLNDEWNIPEFYKKLDVRNYVTTLHSELFGDYSNFADRVIRLNEELELYSRMQLFDVIRAITWIINILSSTDAVYGVGRGSSVSSYVLYVIGAHDVDSFEYQLDISDFLRT